VGGLATLALAALLFGGPLGVLVAILLLLVIVDVLLPMPAETWAEADGHFRRLLRERRRARRLRRLRGRPEERL
jgi:hypothetical protein